jgi:hypothetical protein
MASYSSVGTFREDMQTLLYNARVTGGRGTQLWDDLNVLELRDSGPSITRHGRWLAGVEHHAPRDLHNGQR